MEVVGGLPCLRRPNLFSRKRKDWGEKSAGSTGLVLQCASEGAIKICWMVRIRIGPLALPLGELSPQATERVLGLRLPSPSSLCSDTSPKGRGKKGFEERKFLAYIHQTSPERSEKTASVFLVSSRRSGGKSKSLQTLFLSFSFGEAKENAGPHSQICRRLSNHCKSTIYYFKRSRKERPLSLVLPRM